MGSFCRIHSLSGYIVVWSVAILRAAGGGNITWYEPAPFETVTDTAIVSSVNKNLTEGSLNQELSCNFSLAAGLDILTVSMKFGREPVVNYAHALNKLSVQSGFISRLNATWVPNKLTLILFNVTSAVKGEYRCEVVSVGDQVENWARTIQVSLLVPPRITEISGETVTEGEDVYLKCIAEGKPTPSITWKRLSDNSVVTMPLVNIRRHDKKDYICTADNGVETPADREVSIDVQYPVEVTGPVRNVSVAKGVDKNVSCPVDGNPEPNIIWYRGHGESRLRIFFGKQLTVTGESGCYTCVANNSLGTSVSLTRCLIVEHLPAATNPTSTPIPEGHPRTVIGVVVGVAVFMAIVTIGVVTWWMRKKRKSEKKMKRGEQQRLEVDPVDNGERLE